MKKVLFVCIENSCRSQMAEGFAKRLGKGIIEAYSAGSKPSGEVNPMAIEVMKEKGIDISSHKSKGFFNLNVKDFDYSVTLGCQDICPFVPADTHIEWAIPDPKGRDKEFFRKIASVIESKIMTLIKEIKDGKTF
ncbi:MAG: arsenate reductase ArsC [Candidatus Omnitrophica bacterium]|nr:arsenate reductase ArsC [Candidatus Omnitrophota bacterium]